MKRRIRLLLSTAGVALTLSGTVAAEANAAPRPPAPTRYDRYVALGDSYTAAPLVPLTDPAGGCFRSNNNYPSQLARTLQVKTLVDVSCSGAKSSDLTGSQQTPLAVIPPQLNAVTADTDLVTVSIGGNDEDVFGTLVGHCTTLRAKDPTGSPCRDEMRSGSGDRLLQATDRTRQRVTKVVGQIRQRAPRAKIVVVGYPQIIPQQGTCPILLPLADGDYRYTRQVNQRLTDALRHAAQANKVSYVDIWTASRGHDICGRDPWINGQFPDPVRGQSYHPFGNEQTAIAGLVVGQLRGRVTGLSPAAA